jgi:ketosteroid isomerase-like protein
MSKENVEIVKRAADAFNRRDMRALAEASHEDLEFVSVLTAVDAGGASYHGSGAWASYFEAMNETWEDWRAEDFRFFDAGEDRVVGEFRLVGKGKHSGARVEREIGLAYRIRDGKLWRMRSYLDPNEALKAVGLRE